MAESNCLGVVFACVRMSVCVCVWGGGGEMDVGVFFSFFPSGIGAIWLKLITYVLVCSFFIFFVSFCLFPFCCFPFVWILSVFLLFCFALLLFLLMGCNC